MPVQIESLSTQNPVIGIDLGTTNSLVAIVRNGRPEVLNSRENQHLLPSIVSFSNSTGEPVVGLAAKQKKVQDASHTVFFGEATFRQELSRSGGLIHAFTV